jgi:hypothetical protein
MWELDIPTWGLLIPTVFTPYGRGFSFMARHVILSWSSPRPTSHSMPPDFSRFLIDDHIGKIVYHYVGFPSYMDWDNG